MNTRKTTTVTNLPHFAKKVMEVARSLPSDKRFGPNKVYIYCVWESGFRNNMSLEEFKELLKQCSIQGLLYLSRADLVMVMNQEWLHKSEIQWEPGNDCRTSHFILDV